MRYVGLVGEDGMKDCGPSLLSGKSEDQPRHVIWRGLQRSPLLSPNLLCFLSDYSLSHGTYGYVFCQVSDLSLIIVSPMAGGAS